MALGQPAPAQITHRAPILVCPGHLQPQRRNAAKGGLGGVRYTILQNTPPGPSHAQLIIAGRDGHSHLRPPTMQTLSTVTQQAQVNHALTHRGHTPLDEAHATAYVRARDLTAAATSQGALRARDGHTPVQRRLRIWKEQLSGVPILLQPCLLCGGPEETPVHMHVGCAHSRVPWPHYRQVVQEAARHVPPGDKALWVASSRSAGAGWTEVFCSGLVPEAAEAQLRVIACYDPPGGTTVDEFLQHMPRLGDFVWELRNHRLEQLLRAPLSTAARVHRWLDAAEGDCPCPLPRPGGDFAASLRIVSGTLACPLQEDPHPYRDLPGGFSKHLQGALFAPWIIGRGSMTTWEAHIVGAEWAREWSLWCATTRAGDPRAAVRRHRARGVGAAHPATSHHDLRGFPRSPVGRGGRGMAVGGPGVPRGVERGCVLAHPGALPPPLFAPRRQRAPSHGDTHMGVRRGHHPVAHPRRRGHRAHRGAFQRQGTSVR